MSDRDDTPGIALAVAVATAGWVVAGVLALAVSSLPLRPAGDNVVATVAETLGPVERIGFEPGSAALSVQAQEPLERAAGAARRDDGLSLLLLPFVEPEADAPGVAVAEARGRAVRQALEAHGVPAQRIMLARPEPVTGSGAARTALQVEVRLQ